MKAILFGATGMIGQAVLRECLLDPAVEKVLAVGRSASGKTHDKLTDLVHTPLDDLSSVASELEGYDACFFCLGVSSAGMSEADYRRVTYDLAVSAAKTLLAKNPSMVFLFISGRSTNANGSMMWARVKGETENALLAMGFRGAYMFRPGVIVPMNGIKPRSAVYRVFYVLGTPLLPIIRWLAPRSLLTTESLGRAMIAVARNGSAKKILEVDDINAVPV